jgi:demethylmacrocin O-methyltransferase
MDATSLKTLDQIAIEKQTDRASVFTRTYGKPHDYARHYDKLFAPFRDQPLTMLEIGVGGGEGIKMWLEYFNHPDVYMVGVDIVEGTNPYDTKKSGVDARYHFCPGDQTRDEFWQYFIKYYGDGFDIIIDDGLHSNIAVITTFNALWQHVKPGGFYAVEDLNVAYGGPSFFVSPAWPNQVDFLKGKIDELNRVGGIDSIYFSKELAVLRKAMTCF